MLMNKTDTFLNEVWPPKVTKWGTSRASDFFKIGGPKRPNEQKMASHFLE